ncbi:MAG: hypothetical protein JO227_16460 [Acetobacteraceae bacterium]|nr:hypothetical protein [Acetobacteraceae bacterium]
MYRQDSWMSEADVQEAADRQTASLGGVAITLVLLILGLLLVRQLHTKAAIEDCLMAGRINCDLLVTGP